MFETLMYRFQGVTDVNKDENAHTWIPPSDGREISPRGAAPIQLAKARSILFDILVGHIHAFLLFCKEVGEIFLIHPCDNLERGRMMAVVGQWPRVGVLLN